jgi:hypothetical protein
MYASIEYLLSGLPVVTTPGLGGRHEFFDPGFSITVDPTPKAVAAGVDEAIAADLDPHWIRAITLEKVHEHRVRFVAAVQEILDEAGHGRDFASEWDDVFIPKLFSPAIFGGEAIDEHNRSLVERLGASG